MNDMEAMAVRAMEVLNREALREARAAIERGAEAASAESDPKLREGWLLWVKNMQSKSEDELIEWGCARVDPSALAREVVPLPRGLELAYRAWKKLRGNR